MEAARAYHLEPLSAGTREKLIDALRTSINEDHRTQSQLAQIAGLSDAELANLLDSAA